MTTGRQAEFKLAVPTATASSAAALPDEKVQAALAALQEAYKATGNYFLTMYKNSLSEQQKAAEITINVFDRLNKEREDVVTFKALHSFQFLLLKEVLKQIDEKQHDFYRSFLPAMRNLVKIYRSIQTSHLRSDTCKQEAEEIIATLKKGNEKEIRKQFNLLPSYFIKQQELVSENSPVVMPKTGKKKVRFSKKKIVIDVPQKQKKHENNGLNFGFNDADARALFNLLHKPVVNKSPISPSPSSSSKLSSYLFFAGLCALLLGGILTAIFGVGIPLIVCGVVGFALCLSGGIRKHVEGSVCPTTLPVEKNANPVKNYAIPVAMIATSHPAPTIDAASTPVASTPAAAPSPANEPALTCGQQSPRM